jgi:hypothetical protein
MYSLQAAESQVKRYESRLSEEDIVPADTNAIQALREQLGVRDWQIQRKTNLSTNPTNSDTG